MLPRRFPNWSNLRITHVWMENHSRIPWHRWPPRYPRCSTTMTIEILLRLGFPTTLVHAALVCKRWLHHVSDRKFLCRFRKLHPPRVLGYYVSDGSVSRGEPDATRFFPMLPQPPELASVISRLESVRVGAHGAVQIMDCRNGSVFTRRCEGRVLTHVVHHPLCPERGMCLVPPLPRFQDLKQQVFSAILSKEEEGSLSYLYLMSQYSRETIKSIMRVYMLQDGVWRMHTLATSQFNHPRMQPKPVLVGNNIYMASSFDDDIFVLDLTTSSFSSIQLPQGVKYYFYNTILSRADDASSVYLIHVPIKEFQLRIWLHRGETGCWSIPFVCMRCLLIWGF